MEEVKDWESRKKKLERERERERDRGGEGKRSKRQRGWKMDDVNERVEKRSKLKTERVKK